MLKLQDAAFLAEAVQEGLLYRQARLNGILAQIPVEAAPENSAAGPPLDGPDVSGSVSVGASAQPDAREAANAHPAD